MCFPVFEEKFGGKCEKRDSDKLQGRLLIPQGHLTPCVSSFKIKVVSARGRVQVAYATRMKRYVHGKGLIPAHVACSAEVFTFESSQYKFHLAQALKPHDICKLYNSPTSFKKHLKRQAWQQRLIFSDDVGLHLGGKETATTSCLLFSKPRQATRYKRDSPQSEGNSCHFTSQGR